MFTLFLGCVNALCLFARAPQERLQLDAFLAVTFNISWILLVVWMLWLLKLLQMGNACFSKVKYSG